MEPLSPLRLERLAITVPDLTAWISKFELLLGAGFQRATVQQATGAVEIAIHPAGIELVGGDPTAAPALRSFHLTGPDIEEGLRRAETNGWRHSGRFTFDDRQHDVLDVEGVRVLLLEDPAHGMSRNEPTGPGREDASMATTTQSDRDQLGMMIQLTERSWVVSDAASDGFFHRAHTDDEVEAHAPTVEDILDRVTPRWRDEVPEDGSYRWGQLREASSRAEDLLVRRSAWLQ
jgi:hypothetical protein